MPIALKIDHSLEHHGRVHPTEGTSGKTFIEPGVPNRYAPKPPEPPPELIPEPPPEFQPMPHAELPVEPPHASKATKTKSGKAPSHDEV